LEDFYQARDLLEEWVRYYNEERLHSALNYLRPADYCRSNPETLLAERKRKLKTAALRRKEVNRQNGLATINTGVYPFSRVDLSENDCITTSGRRCRLHRD